MKAISTKLLPGLYRSQTTPKAKKAVFSNKDKDKDNKEKPFRRYFFEEDPVAKITKQPYPEER